MKVIFRNIQIVMENSESKNVEFYVKDSSTNIYNFLVGLKAGVEYSLKFETDSNGQGMFNAYSSQVGRDTTSLEDKLFEMRPGSEVKFTPLHDIDILYIYYFKDVDAVSKCNLNIRGASFYLYNEEVSNDFGQNLNSGDMAYVTYNFDRDTIYKVTTGLGLVNLYNSGDESKLMACVYKNNKSTIIRPSSSFPLLYVRNWSDTTLTNVKISKLVRQVD